MHWHWDVETIMRLGVLALILGGIAFGAVSLWIKVQRFAREGRRLAPPMSDELAMRLDRIERIVETTAIEVERVSEAQRFVARQVAEAAAPKLPSARGAGAVNTPH